MNVCYPCRQLNSDLATYWERRGELLTQGGAAGRTADLRQQQVGSAELDRLVIGGATSLGQTNAAQQLFHGVEPPDADGTADPLNGPTGRTFRSAPEWDQ